MMSAHKIMPPLHWLLLVLFSMVLIAPAFWLGAGGEDLHCQSLWVKHFSTELWHGTLYPRWLPDMFEGRGSPVFFYYPPLAYYITALFNALRPLDAFGYYAIAASAFCAIFASGLTFYLWMQREGAHTGGALIGSLLYMAAPFHVAQNFYHTLLISSLWAYVWVPLLLLQAKKLMQAKPYALIGFAAALVLLILTNLPMTLIWGPIAVAYALLQLQKESYVKQCMRLALAVLLGFGLAAFYLLPALSYMDYVNIDLHWAMPVAEYIFHLGFADPAQTYYTLYWLAALTLLALYSAASWRTGNNCRFFCVAAFFSLILMLPVSLPLWERLSILRILQSSTRFFSVVFLGIALLAAFAQPRLKIVSYIVLLCFVLYTILISTQLRFTEASFASLNPQGYERFSRDIDQTAHYLTTASLIPLYFTREGLSALKAHDGQVEILEGDAQVQVEIWKPRLLTLHYQAAAPSLINVRQFYFPGWRAFVGERELEIVRDEKTGEMKLALPAGEGDIMLRLEPLLRESTGALISIFSALSVAILLLRAQRRHGQSSVMPNNA